jgi:hypothetical protein
MKTILKIATLLGLFAAAALGQANTLSSTTLSAALTIAPGGAQQQVCLTSTTNVVAPTNSAAGSLLFVDREALQVAGPVVGSCVPVFRGASGTPTQPHTTGILVWIGDPTWYINKDYGQEQWGASCTASALYASPLINLKTGNWAVCDSTSRITYAGPWGEGGNLPASFTTHGDSAYSALATDTVIVYTTLSTTRLVTLPAATSLPGKVYIIKNGTSSAQSITVATVDTSATFACETATAWGACSIISNGTVWYSFTGTY